MNKNLFLSMFAATGMLLATSCSNDDLTAVQSVDEAQVSFTLGLEGGIGSRAISDGTGAKKLVYAVYNADGELIETIANADENGQIVDDQAFDNGLTETVNITLAKGQQYTIAFWAQNPSCKAYDTDDLKAVGVSYVNEDGTPAANNDELRDAFFKAETFKVVGNKEINVTLKRPFAQINVGVTAADWKAAVESGVEITESKVVIKNAATSINLLDGKVSGEYDVEYDLATIPEKFTPAETLEVDVNGNGTIEEDEKYKWLSMSYILVNETTTGDERATLNGLQYTFSPENGEDIEFKEGLAGAPVQRNWRTNILGKILTGDIQFNITIDPVYDGDIIYPDGQAQDLELAAAFGGTVNLTENVTLTVPLNVTADMILNMNGKTISGNFHKNVGAIIKNYGTLTINGGTISSTGENGGSAVQNNGTMTINEATLNGAPNANGSWPSYTVNNTGNLTINNSTITSYHGAVASYGDNAVVTLNNSEIDMTGIPGFTSHGIYTYNNGKVIVNGGTYKNKATDQNTSGASVINGAVEVTAGNFSGRIENYSGTPVLKGGTYSVEPKDIFIATGYKVIKKDGLFYVVSNDIDAIVSSNEDFATSLMNGGTIILNEGEYTFPAGNVFAGEVKVIAAEGANVVVNLPKSTYIPGTQLTLEGLTFTTPAGLTYTEGAFGFIHHAAEFNMNNCVIEGGRLRLNVAKANIDKCQFNVTASSGFDGYGLFYYGNNGSTINVSNSTFTALQKAIVLYNETSVNMNLNVDNCTFTASQTTDKAAISIHSELGINGTVNITNSTATGFANHHGGLWRDVNNNNGQDNKNFTVTVDGEIAAVKGFGAITKGYYAIGDTYTVLSGEGFKAVATEVLSDASKNITIELAKNIDLTNIEWPAVRTNAEFVLDGKGYSIMNLTTSAVEDHGFYSTAMFTSTRKAATIKNLIVENATVTGNGMANSHGAVLVACNYSSLNISGVTVKNSTVSNCDRSAVITTYLYFTDATVENCVVEGCTVNSIGTAGAILGMNNSKNFEATGNKVKDTTISSSEGNNKAGILIGTWQNAGTLTEEGNTVENSKAINAGTETNNNIGRTV